MLHPAWQIIIVIIIVIIVYYYYYYYYYVLSHPDASLMEQCAQDSLSLLQPSTTKRDERQESPQFRP